MAKQALILAGGEGTRLRPLTLTVPKPVMPLASRPFLTFLLDWVHGHGVEDVVLSCGYRSDAVEDVLGDEYAGMSLHYVHEETRLGTAGPVRLALDAGLLHERLFVLNGDVLTDADLGAELAQHEATGARVTLGLIAVEDTSSYGVVPTQEGGEVDAFLEKQEGPVPTNRVNGGMYIVEREVVEGLDAGRPISFEREVFPGLVGEGLYGYQAEGYWIDIGTPDRYLEATYDLLGGKVDGGLPPRDETGSLVCEGSIVSGAHIGPQSCIGTRCSVGSDSEVARSVLFDGVRVGADARIESAVLADGVQVGDGAKVAAGAVIGKDAVVAPRAVVGENARVAPEEHVA
ncbi:MAG: NDP-sugar synthase [Thermoleophilaceae bacterium]|nr:NDP-sugar synthase [Thermoleophilaceae bacterium]